MMAFECAGSGTQVRLCSAQPSVAAREMSDSDHVGDEVVSAGRAETLTNRASVVLGASCQAIVV